MKPLSMEQRLKFNHDVAAILLLFGFCFWVNRGIAICGLCIYGQVLAKLLFSGMFFRLEGGIFDAFITWFPGWNLPLRGQESNGCGLLISSLTAFWQGFCIIWEGGFPEGRFWAFLPGFCFWRRAWPFIRLAR